MTEEKILNKTYQIYKSFDEWINAHKHSSLAVELELDTRMDEIKRYPPDGLSSYISGLKDLRSEIDSEIFEAKDWIEYFDKNKSFP